MYEVYATKFAEPRGEDNKHIGMATIYVDKKFVFNGLRVYKNTDDSISVFPPAYSTGEGEAKTFTNQYNIFNKAFENLVKKAVVESMETKTSVSVEKYVAPTEFKPNVTVIDNEKDTRLAKVSLQVGNEITIDTIAIRQGNNELFVNMPSYKNKAGEWTSYCNPITTDFYNDLNDCILKIYDSSKKERDAFVKEHTNISTIEPASNYVIDLDEQEDIPEAFKKPDKSAR